MKILLDSQANFALVTAVREPSRKRSLSLEGVRGLRSWHASMAQWECSPPRGRLELALTIAIEGEKIALGTNSSPTPTDFSISTWRSLMSDRSSPNEDRRVA
jgi:hypothetical protein